MPKRLQAEDDDGGTWNFRAVPRDLMKRAKIAGAVQGKSVKQLLIELMEAHLADLEKKGVLPKGKG